MKEVLITKATGEKEFFDAKKLNESLVRSGASEVMARHIIEMVEKSLVPEMSTSEIYHKAFSLLHKKERTAAMRYSLAKALADLGPSGFPFEQFLQEMLKAEGYTVERDVIVQGACVEHEVDLIASKDDRRIYVEVKFHNERGIKSDLKVALYVSARFEDIAKVDKKDGKKEEIWLMTNTKFSHSAVQYALCKGLTVIGWDYPSENSLHERIERSGLHPLTCLPSLTNAQKKVFFENGVVLCKDVIARKDVLDSLGITGEKLNILKEDINALCCSV
jgi:hypothetical protein